MGCTTSAHYPPDIVNLQEIDSDGETTKYGNYNSRTTAVGNTSGNTSEHTPTKTTTTIVRFSDHSSTTDSSNNKENDMKKEVDTLRGDVTQRHNAKLARQQKLLEKQKKVSSAAEELANQVLEEKERLSLTSRSRGTSRATSRTGSPTGTRKYVAFKPQEPEVKSEGGDVNNMADDNRNMTNGGVRANS